MNEIKFEDVAEDAKVIFSTRILTSLGSVLEYRTTLTKKDGAILLKHAPRLGAPWQSTDVFVPGEHVAGWTVNPVAVDLS